MPRLFLIALSAIAALLARAPPAFAAAPPLCEGRSLIATAEVEAPKQLAEARKLAAAVPNGKHVFWRIGGARTGKPSWLFGTIHLTDDRTRIPPAPAVAALAGASVLAVEVVEASDPAKLGALFASKPHLVALPAGREIWDLLGDTGSRQLKRRLSAFGGNPAAVSRLQPWLVATSFSVPRCEAQRVLLGLDRLDDALIKEARSKGLAVIGLETVEEQIEAMAAMPIEEQADQLLSVLDDKVTAEDRQETLVRIYLDRQLAIVFPLMEMAYRADPRLAASFRHVSETLILKRNRLMAERAIPWLDKGGVFIAVGAVHLPGEDGLVELVRQAGFELVAVD